MAAEKGNKYAYKGDEGKTSFLHIRATKEDKASWVKAANRNGQKLAQWVTETLNKAAED